MIHYSPLPDVEIPDLPLTDYVLAGGAGQPDKPAMIDGASGRVLTYGELEAAIRSLAGGLVAAGFGPGDVLALMAPNSPAGPSRRSTRPTPRPRCTTSSPTPAPGSW
jgi:acyl-CoA synthetase (AMP-forming)/AMP-acid ligase II